jgi:hypothetical protein
MVENNRKVQITANSPIAATWGFNYYLKYYANSSLHWSGKNINLKKDKLPLISNKIRIEAKDRYASINRRISLINETPDQ